ncbi:signal peptidase I [Alkalicella caledoniensis]|uniref:Signal peptidase I n=1 Tax=Alkalicella caledoniensis TaxID=2731377 RepID=A0A7G9WCH5_ALKCA|nr:signal peptidase I [Alkalicella caledoniensis]QNO16387.1 signal peptidase I [Alkalicella caledoniensis]
MKKIIEIAEILILVLVITFVLNTYVFSLFRVYGISMEPTLQESDLLLVKKWGTIKKGDIIVFYESNQGINLVKRVVGVPGDKVQSDGDNIIINDKEIVQHKSDEFSFTLMNDEYYLIGDNFMLSEDSREFGPVKKDFILGTVLIRIWPIF